MFRDIPRPPGKARNMFTMNFYAWSVVLCIITMLDYGLNGRRTPAPRLAVVAVTLSAQDPIVRSAGITRNMMGLDSVSGETSDSLSPNLRPLSIADVRRNPLLFWPCFGPSNGMRKYFLHKNKRLERECGGQPSHFRRLPGTSPDVRDT